MERSRLFHHLDSRYVKLKIELIDNPLEKEFGNLSISEIVKNPNSFDKKPEQKLLLNNLCEVVKELN